MDHQSNIKLADEHASTSRRREYRYLHRNTTRILSITNTLEHFRCRPMQDHPRIQNQQKPKRPRKRNPIPLLRGRHSGSLPKRRITEINLDETQKMVNWKRNQDQPIQKRNLRNKSWPENTKITPIANTRTRTEIPLRIPRLHHHGRPQHDHEPEEEAR